MADPKYENLPGIAYDQPDVYETGDLPEADQQEAFEEEDNECIEQLHLSVNDSFNKFRGKFLTGNVDFSDRLTKKSRIGYRAGEWELAAEGEPETPLEKYNRLRCEFSELLEQIVEQQNKATESEKDEYSKLATQISATKKLLEELKLDEGENVDPKAEKLKEYLISNDKRKQGNVVTAALKLKSEADVLLKTARIARLEHRLHRLEQTTGIRDEDTFRKLQAATGEATLCGAAAQLAVQKSLLKSGELAAADARIASLLANADALKQAINPAHPEMDEKVNELHKLLKQIEGISHSEILERMEALEALHNQASNFSKSLMEMETLQNTIVSGVQNNKELLQGVQEVFAHNIDTIQKEIKKLDDRINKLASA
ncbi:Dynactin subunit 2 [Eumeta japonica]|uniref:Dynactin subunit 2 n=1 Tax=Eumeta variegata TaxID=151549 RepID=A0A4C1ST99_EUMVA|nr:Dynactin subunit 2 [Eumeta japonica]